MGLRWPEKTMPDDVQDLFLENKCKDFIGDGDESGAED